MQSEPPATGPPGRAELGRGSAPLHVHCPQEPVMSRVSRNPAFRKAVLPAIVAAADFDMFRSYEPGRDGYVTIVANYLPLQDPYGGPNYFKLDPNALYQINISNDGGAAANLTFTFKFQNTLADNQIPVGGKMVSIPLTQN